VDADYVSDVTVGEKAVEAARKMSGYVLKVVEDVLEEGRE